MAGLHLKFSTISTHDGVCLKTYSVAYVSNMRLK